MTHSEQINEIAKALAVAQGVIKGAKKDSENPFFKSKYADLAAVSDACRMPLSNAGIAVVQAPASTEDGRVSVTTMLVHSSGQWMAETLTVKPKDDGAQAMGSVITYLRRYSLAAFAGVAPEDDDGNAAEGRNGHAKPIAVASVVTPDGYGKWLEEFSLVADEGYDRISTAFKASKKEYRAYLTGADKDKYAKLQNIARAVDARAKPQAVGA